MIRHVCNWLDERTGYRRATDAWRNRTLAGGARWWLASGSCLLWLLVVEVVTGLLLMATYSPSTTDAWASVRFIEQAPWGSFIRGLHYFTAQGIILLLGLHLIRILLMGAFQAPRELVWASGLLLIPLMLFWAVTGSPLAWTEKGYNQISVETNILASTPLIGPVLRRILVGGDELGNLTLTHLYALHVALLPGAVGLLLLLHVQQIFRHGLSVQASGESQEAAAGTPYWPHQSARNMLVLAVVLGTIGYWAWRGGAPLEAPAQPGVASVPRPEWYFLFLFELRRYFSPEQQILATGVIPALAIVLLLLMPAVCRVLPQPLSVAFRVLVVIGGLGCWGTLTFVAVQRDWRDPAFQHAQQQAEQRAARAWELTTPVAVPPPGAALLLQRDPLTKGQELFVRHCATCHAYGSEIPAGGKAADLKDYGTAGWVRGLLAKPANEKYFGHTQLTGMIEFVEDNEDLDEVDQADWDRVAQWLGTHPRELPDENDENSAFASRFEAFQDWCADCHRYGPTGGNDGPDLTGWGDAAYIRSMIMAPDHPRRYGQTNKMPLFRDLADADAQVIKLETSRSKPSVMHLGAIDRELIIRWMTGDDRPVIGGEPIRGASEQP